MWKVTEKITSILNIYTYIHTHSDIHRYDTSFTYIYLRYIINIHTIIIQYPMLCVIGSTNHESRASKARLVSKVESRKKI